MSEMQSIGQAAQGVVKRLNREQWKQEVEPVLVAVSFAAAGAAREAEKVKTLADMVIGKLPDWDTFAAADLDEAEKQMSKALNMIRSTKEAMRAKP